MRVAVVQHDIVWEDPAANFEHLAPLIGAAAAGGARLVVLTETYSTGFTSDTRKVAEPVNGPSTRFLVEQAAFHDVWVCGSLPEKPEGHERPYNRLVLAGPDGTVHRYAKIHPFTYAGEHHNFDAGMERVTVEIEGIRFSLFVCYDLRFADEFWAVAGRTDAYIVVANWPETRRLHWQALLLARAIENQAYVIAGNRVGTGGDLTYVGDSRIIDPLGELLATGAKGETILFADIDADIVADVRSRFPFLPDRRS